MMLITIYPKNSEMSNNQDLVLVKNRALAIFLAEWHTSGV